MANLDKQSPGLVHVQISLSQEQAPRLKEKVKRATKRHELVEVDDFIFRRKRRSVAPSPAAARAVAAAAVSAPRVASHDSPAAAITHALQLDGQSPVAAVPAARDDDSAIADQAGGPAAPATADDRAAAAQPTKSAAAAASPASGPVPAPTPSAAAGARDQEQQDTAQAASKTPAAEACTLTAAEAEAAPEEPTKPVALQFTVAPSELCDLVEWVFFNERKKLPGTTADDARAAAAQFKEQFAGLLAQHTAAKAAAQQAKSAGTVAAPHLTVLPYLLEQQKAALQDKRERLLQEEAHWLLLQQQYDDLNAAATALAVAAEPCTLAATIATAEPADADAGTGGNWAAAAVPDPNAAAGPLSGTPAVDAATAAVAEAAAGPVCREQEGKIRSVQLKVEMLVALVSKMEHLVSSAESVARTLQAGYHSEKFKVFPHVNSPAALIKSIISSQQQGSAAGDGNAS